MGAEHPFADMLAAVEEQIRFERIRIDRVKDHLEVALRDLAEDHLCGWEWRLEHLVTAALAAPRLQLSRLEGAAIALHALIPHEATIRQLDPALSPPRPAPTMWPVDAAGVPTGVRVFEPPR